MLMGVSPSQERDNLFGELAGRPAGGLSADTGLVGGVGEPSGGPAYKFRGVPGGPAPLSHRGTAISRHHRAEPLPPCRTEEQQRRISSH